MTELDSALVELSSLLEELAIPYMLIGGLAVSVWGVPRATLDVDLTVWVEPEQLPGAVAAIAARVRALPEDPLRFVCDTRVLPVMTASGVRADIVFGALPVQLEAIERACGKPVSGKMIRVVSIEDLIFMKLISEREKDLGDARALLRRFARSLDMGYLKPRLAELAQALARPDILEIFQRETGPGEER